MAVTTRDSTPAGIAVRVHMLEEVVDKLVPSEGGDLAALTDAVNKLYNYVLLGGNYSGDTTGGITYEDSHWFNDSANSPDGWYSASIVSITYGGDMDRFKTMSFAHQVFAGSNADDFAGDFSAGGTESQYYKSIFGSIWGGSGALEAIRARGSNIVNDIGNADSDHAVIMEQFDSVLGAIYRGFEDEAPFTTKSIARLIWEILQKLEDHETRIDNLEWP